MKPGFGGFTRLCYSQLQGCYSDEAEAFVSSAKRALTHGILTGLFLGAQPTRATTGLQISVWAQPGKKLGL